MRILVLRKILGIIGLGFLLYFWIFFPVKTLAELNIVTVLGQATLPTGLLFEETEVGGLSGITYHQNQEIYYAISDDRSNKNTARFYTLKIDLSSGKIEADNLNLTAVNFLSDQQGQPFPPFSLDPEAIAFTGNSLFIASEGDVRRSQPPFLKEFSLTGQELRSLPIPHKFLSAKNYGIRNNLAFESLSLTPDGRYLFTAVENALIQDGEKATIKKGSPCRILRYNLTTGQPDQEFLYITDPIVAIPGLSSKFQISGLVDLLALDETHLIALERSFALGIGNTIQLFEVSLDGADRIQALDRLKGEMIKLSPTRKTLLLNFNQLNLKLDNIEGLTFGPVLSNGMQSLILISDNNFQSFQVTQIIALSLDRSKLSQNQN